MQWREIGTKAKLEMSLLRKRTRKLTRTEFMRRYMKHEPLSPSPIKEPLPSIITISQGRNRTPARLA